MKVVSNTSPIVNLAAIGQLDLLRQLFGTIIIPDAVYHEIVVQGAGRPGATEVQTLEWIITRTARDVPLVKTLKLEVHTGEAEALALALEIKADWVLLDERRARRLAEGFGLSFTGLLGILERARAKSLLPAVRPLLDDLCNKAGFWISPMLYDHILKRVGEAP